MQQLPQPNTLGTMSRAQQGHIYYSSRSASSSGNYRPLQLHSSQSQASLCSSTYRSKAGRSSSTGAVSNAAAAAAAAMSQSDTKPARYSLNSLGHIWYGLLAILLQVCIVSRKVQRFTAYLELPWPLHQQPLFELNAYVVLTALAVVILPFFFVCTVVRVGNLANDGVKLSAEPSSAPVSPSSRRRGCSVRRALDAAWTHAPPLMGLLHLATALCFLCAQNLMQTELIKHGFLSQERIWNSELEPMLSRAEHSSFTAWLASRLHSFLRSPEAQPHAPLLSRPPVLPEHEVRSKLQLDGYNLELLNLLAALLQLCLRYPAVLWPAQRSLALLLSAHTFLTSFVALLAYAAHSAYARWRALSSTTQSFDSHVTAARDPARDALTVGQSTAALTLWSICLLLSCVALHAYALRKRVECVQRRALLRARHLAERPPRAHVSYAPHYFAAACLLLSCAAALPLLHALCTLYVCTGHARPLVACVVIASHILLQLILWIILTCKRRWSFAGVESKHSPSSNGGTSHTGLTEEFKHVLNNQLSSQLQGKLGSSTLSGSLCGQSLSSYGVLGPQLKSCLKSAARPYATTGRRPQHTTVDAYGRDAYSDSEGLCDEMDKQRKRNAKFALRERPALGGCNTLPVKRTTISQDYADYGGVRRPTLPKIQNGSEEQASTHMNLCPLQSDTGYMSDYDMMRSSASNQPLVMSAVPKLDSVTQFKNQQQQAQQQAFYNQQQAIYSHQQQMQQSIYGQQQNRQLMSSNAIYQGLQSIKEHFTSVSDSDTSSGIHSATTGSLVSGPKRSDSMEQLINCIQAPKPFLNSLSLQRQTTNAIYQTRPMLVDGIFEPPAQFVPISAADPVYGTRPSASSNAPMMSTFSLSRPPMEQHILPPTSLTNQPLPPPPPQLLQSPPNSAHN